MGCSVAHSHQTRDRKVTMFHISMTRVFLNWFLYTQIVHLNTKAEVPVTRLGAVFERNA